MTITMQDVRAVLTLDEVDYHEARKLGPEAIPFLKKLVQGGDLNLASKAAYLATLITSERSTEVLEAAAASQEPVVRVAAASGIRNLPERDADRVMERLRDDPDAGVRKVALKSVSTFKSPRLAAKVQKMADEDPEPFVRELANSTARKMGGANG